MAFVPDHLEEAEKDRRLRNAAPELLAALEALVSSFDAAPGIADTNAPAFQKARAAIAMARGL